MPVVLPILRIAFLILLNTIFFVQMAVSLGWRIAGGRIMMTACLSSSSSWKFPRQFAPKYFVDIRTSWTLEDPETRRPTHRLAGAPCFLGRSFFSSPNSCSTSAASTPFLLPQFFSSRLGESLTRGIIPGRMSRRAESTELLSDHPQFRRSLRRWFRLRGRDLPWRRTQDPYAILVSEFMLQQTQVATVISYYQRWLDRFPGFAALAQARESDVLHAWQGLGYYARARHLHASGKLVTENFGGELPADAARIAQLPGCRSLHCRRDRQFCLRSLRADCRGQYRARPGAPNELAISD